MHQALGLLETTGWTPAIMALDAMAKAASIDVVQAELNDFLGVCIKVAGSVDHVAAAIDHGQRVATRCGGDPRSQVIRRVDSEAWKAILSREEFNPLIQQFVVQLPKQSEEHVMAENLALGFIETQGFTAVFEAIDTACKAANVEVIGKEKLGGGYVTVVIRGNVAAVEAAIEAGAKAVASLGKLIAAHVIARPSPAVLAILPE